MNLIPVLSKTVKPSICPDCRQAVTLASGEDDRTLMFSGDPAGVRMTKTREGDLVDHFDEAELHGCQK